MNDTTLIAPLSVNQTPMDYAVSNAIKSALLVGGVNYAMAKKNKISNAHALKSTMKISAQTAIASGSAIASVKYFVNKNYLSAALSLCVGASGIVAIEKLSQKGEKNAN